MASSHQRLLGGKRYGGSWERRVSIPLSVTEVLDEPGDARKMTVTRLMVEGEICSTRDFLILILLPARPTRKRSTARNINVRQKWWLHGGLTAK
jgi:hypothetical protein